jgi:Zn-dependent M28 family amino/carboxypeptidase
VSVDNAAKDSVEHEIRAFVSEIISNPLLRERYFKGRPLHEVASLTGKIKKAYPDKQKSLQSFVSFFEKETSKLI